MGTMHDAFHVYGESLASVRVVHVIGRLARADGAAVQRALERAVDPDLLTHVVSFAECDRVENGVLEPLTTTLLQVGGRVRVVFPRALNRAPLVRAQIEVHDDFKSALLGVEEVEAL